VARSFRRHCQILSAQGRGPSAARESVGRLAMATTPGLAPDFSRTCRLPPRHGQELRFASDSPLEGNGFERSVPRKVGNGFVGSSELGPIYRRTGHPSSCRPRHTPIELSGGGPRSRHSPPGSGGVTPPPRCRRCTTADPGATRCVTQASTPPPSLAGMGLWIGFATAWKSRPQTIAARSL
jgi:hypothetical protein